jgi:menaquinone-9 beta-reductase
MPARWGCINHTLKATKIHLKKVVVIGGGISGLIASILVARRGFECVVFERKSYPIHRVCGEYISNEAVPFLKLHDLYPTQFNPPEMSRFLLSSISGKSKILPLEMGGFGISRFSFDHFLYIKAVEAGVSFKLNTAVENVEFLGQSLKVISSNEEVEGDVVLGAFGKRSNLDARLNRDFMKKRSPYVGIKYHVLMDFPRDMIALHNFPGGYCGVGNVENGVVNVCYLVHREKLKWAGSIAEMEAQVLSQNPFCREIFERAEFLMAKPEVINEFSFEKKTAIENHVLMMGDAAGMITPLCGNGIALAIHSAKIATGYVLRFLEDKSFTREAMERGYQEEWNRNFSRRLYKGRQIQKLFGSDFGSNLAVNLALYVGPVAKEIIRNTHGKAF